VVIGPGSLYTSVLPNLLVAGIQKALVATSATKVFICNVATQHGETDNFSVGDHIETIERHTGKGILNAVVANNNIVEALPEAWQSSAVPIAHDELRAFEGMRLVQADVVAEENRYRHDPVKLAATVMRLYDNRDILPLEPRRPAPPEAPLVATR
jgi:uncharacterized cofD-like protein